jgi:biopolymer transport protein TolR
MAQVMARGGSSRRRRSMSEINMVPFIDVMLVLLIIFMVSAPLITTGVIDLPSVGKSKLTPKSVIELIVVPGDSVKIKVDGQADPQPLKESQIGSRVKQAQERAQSAPGEGRVPVVISAERNVQYDSVVKVMDSLRKAGVESVGLSVKQGQ